MENVACEASTALHVVAAKMICTIEIDQRWELWMNRRGSMEENLIVACRVLSVATLSL
jgi:hypothetical protein